MISLYFSALVASSNKITVFIALQTFGWHFISYLFAASLSSYKFKNDKAKYIIIKSKLLSKILIRKFPIHNGYLSIHERNRTNIIGLVLNIINTALFVLFEAFLFLPKIACEPYIYTLAIPKYVGFNHFNFKLVSMNQIISAEAPRIVAFIIATIYFVFLIIHTKREKKIMQNNRRYSMKKSSKLSLREKLTIKNKSEWRYELYSCLIDISVKQNKKKHKFWFDKTQLNEIENKVSLYKDSKLILNRIDDKLTSFKVIDVSDNHIVFTGHFI